MNPKVMNFWMYAWFVSTLISLILEGSWWGSTHDSNSIINQLSVMQAIKAGGIFSVASATVNFFQGLVRIGLWDYAFYTGSWEYIRYFWLGVLTPGLVFGIYQALAPIFANLMPRLSI